ncbi:MAG TPA: LacI family transcriptional regulator [Bacteroidetes bacterium]|nr:LacI family transcriptional regulator [Bacteroidota bacterium]
MREGRVTIKDIARELGVSPSTVSRALKDHPDISAETKKAVKELAEKYHYQPDAIALSLRSRQTRTIGVVIPEVVHHFFSSVISGIEDVAYHAGYQVMITQSNENYEREVRSIEALLNSRVDGILVSISKYTNHFNHLQKVLEEGVPLVFFDRACEEMEVDRVVVDDYFGAFRAVEHLIKMGCRRIAHFGSAQLLAIAQQRLHGYINALKEYDMKVDERLIIQCDTLPQALKMTGKVLDLSDPPDAIFAINDLTAAGAMKVIKERGLRIPEDIAIVGFTNGQIAHLTDPPLTSVEQHGYDMGREAARMLLDRLTRPNSDYPPKIKILKTRLDIKASSLRKK